MKRESQNRIKGIGASPGRVQGTARVFLDLGQASEGLSEQDILVTAMTDPGWTMCMKKAKAIVTNTGGILCHAAIVARENGIPCVVGTLEATERIEDGMNIVVNGHNGEVKYVSKS